MATITKREIVSDLSDATGMTQTEIANVVERFIELMRQQLSKGNDITFRTFGTFELRVAKAKIGRNPNRPQAEVKIPDRCVVRFKPGKELKDAVASLPTSQITSQGAQGAAE